MCRQRAGCNAGTLTARSLVEAAAMKEGLRGFRGFKGFKGFKGFN